MNHTFEQRHGFYIEDLKPGMSATISKAFSEQDVLQYARLSADDNPLHLDEEFARHARTGGRVIHGMVTASLISAIVGTRLPGPGCLWMSQEMRFVAPVRVGETVTAHAELVELDASRQQVRMTTTCTVESKVVLDGEALMWVPSRTVGYG